MKAEERFANLGKENVNSGIHPKLELDHEFKITDYWSYPVLAIICTLLIYLLPGFKIEILKLFWLFILFLLYIILLRLVVYGRF